MTTEENKTVVVESAPRWTWMILVTICLTLIMIAGVKSCNDWRVARKETQAKQQAVADSIAVAHATVAPTVEALVLMHECLTPCSAYIDYRFQIQGDGSFWARFPPRKNPVLYGSGKFSAPYGTEKGTVSFETNNNKPVIVRVYKKITVQGGQ